MTIFSISEAAPIKKSSATDVCLKSIQEKYEVNISSSFQDDERDYKEYGGFKFGTIRGGYSFVQFGEAVVSVENIKFFDEEHRRIQIGLDSIALDRGILYVIENRLKTTYCLVSPLAGLGSSGSYQRFAALIAFHKTEDPIPRYEGAIYRRLRK
jgi:hypothetical protein